MSVVTSGHQRRTPSGLRRWSGWLRRTAPCAVTATLAMLASACTTGDEPEQRPTVAVDQPGTLSEAVVETELRAPSVTGTGSIAPAVPAAAQPKTAPAQAGPKLAGKALPTSQWWTSALTGPTNRPIWAYPLAVQTTAAGVETSSAAPVASANAVTTPFQPAVTAVGQVESVRVTGYGAFHVVLRAELRGGGSIEATVVQGSPLLYLRFDRVPATLAVPGAGQGAATYDAPAGSKGTGAVTRLDLAGQRWDLIAGNGARWGGQGDRLTATGGDGAIAVARVPDGVDENAWRTAITGSAADPVVETTARMHYDERGGTVTETLVARRRSGGPGPWALLPHQRSGLVADGGVQLIGGTYPTARGTLTLARSAAVSIRVPMPGLLPRAPVVDLPTGTRDAVLAELDRDLADPPGTGGSYFGMKELARLATIAEVAEGVGARDRRDAALGRLRGQLVDWLTYSGGADQRYFGYDAVWGGLIAYPAEFGSNDYNDHHFQYGYLVRAAAVLGAADPDFLRDYGSVVDLVVADYAGTLAGTRAAGLPGFRVFNAYLGHSAASGFSPFADGNNQESSSEAVAAWEAEVRWGLVRNDQNMIRHGATHYALEAATARAYWLGEGLARPAGYAHTVAGVVWDAKIDFATFFDGRPESIQGIQLLPLTFGSLYRSDPKAAAARTAELERSVGGRPRIWADLFAADLALADPVAARGRLVPGLQREPSTSRAMVRYWIEVLAAFGPPQPAVTADGPFGLALGSREKPTLLVVNPTDTRRTVTFRAGQSVVGEVAVDPWGAQLRR